MLLWEKTSGPGFSEDFSKVKTILANEVIIAGPFGPAIDTWHERDHYLGISGQPDIYCWPDRANKRLKTLTKKLQSWPKTPRKSLCVSHAVLLTLPDPILIIGNAFL